MARGERARQTAYLDSFGDCYCRTPSAVCLPCVMRDFGTRKDWKSWTRVWMQHRYDYPMSFHPAIKPNRRRIHRKR